MDAAANRLYHLSEKSRLLSLHHGHFYVYNHCIFRFFTILFCFRKDAFSIKAVRLQEERSSKLYSEPVILLFTGQPVLKQLKPLFCHSLFIFVILFIIFIKVFVFFVSADNVQVVVVGVLVHLTVETHMPLSVPYDLNVFSLLLFLQRNLSLCF